jgi:putative membrane protein
MLRTTLLATGALALAACGQQAAKTETAEAPSEMPSAAAPTAPAVSDAEFVQAVANSDAFEIQSSELAATRATRQDVKNYATMMVRDHRATTSELTALAPRVNLTAPTAQLDASQTVKLDRLRGARGEEFDDDYLDAQVEAHENAVRAFETYIASAQPGPLRDWANATLPKLRTHLSQVQALENAT